MQILGHRWGEIKPVDCLLSSAADQKATAAGQQAQCQWLRNCRRAQAEVSFQQAEVLEVDRAVAVEVAVGPRCAAGGPEVRLQQAEILQIDRSIAVEVALCPAAGATKVVLQDSEILKVDSPVTICVPGRGDGRFRHFSRNAPGYLCPVVPVEAISVDREIDPLPGTQLTQLVGTRP